MRLVRRAHGRLARAALAASGALALLSALAGPAGAADATGGAAAAPAAPPLAADHYVLQLRPDHGAQLLHGHARIRLTSAGGPVPASVDIGSPQLQITQVQVDGSPRPFVRTAAGWRIALDAGPDGLPAAPPRWIELDYSAPAAPGLVFGDQHLHTAFHTCQWLPCVGDDLQRATAAITLDLPAGQRWVASGGDRPHPVYTLGFAAGRFTEATDATDARLRYLGAGVDAAGLQARFSDAARVLRFLEDKAGLPLPNASYTQVLVPGAAAQEASHFAVIGREMLDPILDDPQEDWVVVHEMAHQWWGNLVTCASWNEFWLNEGIVVFITAAWKQHRWGEAAFRRELALLDRRWQRARDAGFDKPLRWDGAYPSLGIRRAIQYSKGALFLQALRAQLGEAAFWDGLRRYTRDNAGRAVRSEDLQAAMERSAGRRLQPLFDQWVGAAAAPPLAATAAPAPRPTAASAAQSSSSMQR